MKATTKTKIGTNYSLRTGNVLQSTQQNNQQMNFTNFTVPNQLSEKTVAPPAHVWDKIAGILDAQDRHKALVENIALSSSPGIKKHSSILLIAGLACIAVAVFTWILL